VNAYGRTKLVGEQALLASGAQALIVRTQWLFGSAGRSFPRTMWAQAQARRPTRVVNDQIGRPTSTRDLAAAVWQLLPTRETGIMHVTNGGPSASWFEVAREVFRRVGAESLLSPCRSAEYPTLAKRPSYSVLDTSRFESIVPGGLPPWRDALTRFLDDLEVSSESGG
jgi:dTDP-4-dehydrorhamnose reductase